MSAGRYIPLGDSIEDSLESYRVHLSPGFQKYENDSPDANSRNSSKTFSAKPISRAMDSPKFPAYGSASPPSIANSAENYEMSHFLSPKLPWKHPDSPSAQSIDESRPIQQLVVWGVGWWKPTLMFSFLLLGMVSAFAHHEYYSHMSGTVTYSLARQQWTIWIGTGFSFLVLFFLSSANGVAFTRYIWVVAKNKDTTIGGLDKLFGLSEDIMGFISPELWRHAKVAILMAFVIWWVWT